MKENEIKNKVEKGSKEAEIKNTVKKAIKKRKQIINWSKQILKLQIKRENLQLWGCQYGEYWHTS